ncbi:MAG: hypothetical protein AAFR67_01800 [Chloroflexota bacterium]
MPVLLLCRGEPKAKERLRRVIEARYGTSPPAIERIIMRFTGKTRMKLGPIHSWVPASAQASFWFPNKLRWEFTAKPLGLPVQKHIEAYDGTTYHSRWAIGSDKDSVETRLLASARGRLWQMAAILLTPMSDHYIEVSDCGEQCIQADNIQLHDSVRMMLRENYSIEQVVVQTHNPDTERVQTLALKLSEDLVEVRDLRLPKQVNAFWDDKPYFELTPTEVELHPFMASDFFTLAD